MFAITVLHNFPYKIIILNVMDFHLFTPAETGLLSKSEIRGLIKSNKGIFLHDFVSIFIKLYTCIDCKHNNLLKVKMLTSLSLIFETLSFLLIDDVKVAVQAYLP